MSPHPAPEPTAVPMVRAGATRRPGEVPAPALLECPVGPLTVPAEPPGGAPVRLSVIVPTFDERRNLAELVRALAAALDPVLGDAYELVVVDDDSPDRTWEEALRLQEDHPQLRVVRRRGERGLSTAVIRGWQVARGEVLGVIDGDLQHPPEVIADLWRTVDRGADLAVGSRHVRAGGVSDWALRRRLLSRGAQLLGLVLLPAVVGRVRDPMSGYFLVRRGAVAGVALSPLGYKILVEVLARGRIGAVAEVGYVFRERTEGESKVSPRLPLQYLRHLLRLRLAGLRRRAPRAGP